MKDFLNIPPKDQEKLIYDLFSIIDFTKSINSGSYYKNLYVIILNIMGEFAATKGFISVSENEQYKVMAHKGMIDISKIEKYINENHIIDDISVISNPELKQTTCDLIICIKRDKILGYIGLGGSMVIDIYEKKKEFYLRAFINIVSLVIDNELLHKEQSDLNKQLEKKIYQLKTIFDTSTELNMQLDEIQIMDITLHTILGHFLISKAIFITYFDNRDTNIIIKGIKEKSELSKVFLNDDYVRHLKENDFVNLEDISKDCFKPLQEQSLYYIFPLKFKDRLLGAVILGKKMSIYKISQQDKEFLKTLLTQALAEILNVRLFKEYTEKTVMEREISIAKDIQHRLLPKTIPEIENYSIDSYLMQCNELGGDFYNIFKIRDDKYAFLVGDVSGKGIPAALIMSNIQALIQAIFTEETDISSGMQRINKLLFESTEMNRYATLIFIILDPVHNKILYTNAGHNQPFLCSQDGNIRYLDKGGIPVGIFPKAVYETEELKINTGDSILLYTDGATEAQNYNEAEFGQANLEHEIIKHREKNSNSIINSIIEALDNFRMEHKQNDDLTLLVIKRIS